MEKQVGERSGDHARGSPRGKTIDNPQRAEPRTRAICADLLLYHEDLFRRSVREGAFTGGIPAELQEGRDLYDQRVTEAIRGPDSPPMDNNEIECYCWETMVRRRVTRSELPAYGYLYIYGGNMAAAIVALVSLVALPAALISGELSPRDGWLIYWLVFALGSLLILGFSLHVWRRHRRAAEPSTNKPGWNPRLLPHFIAVGCVIGAVVLGLMYSQYVSMQQQRKENFCSDFGRSVYRIHATIEACEAQICHCWGEAVRHPAELTASSYLPTDPERRAMVLCLQKRLNRDDGDDGPR